MESICKVHEQSQSCRKHQGIKSGLLRFDEGRVAPFPIYMTREGALETTTFLHLVSVLPGSLAELPEADDGGSAGTPSIWDDLTSVRKVATPTQEFGEWTNTDNWFGDYVEHLESSQQKSTSAAGAGQYDESKQASSTLFTRASDTRPRVH